MPKIAPIHLPRLRPRMPVIVNQKAPVIRDKRRKIRERDDRRLSEK